jgi:thiamine-phosphate pyrophosphorylase
MSDQTAKDRLRHARLYGILDLGYVTPDRIEDVAEKMCAGSAAGAGVDILQLRAKGHDEHAVEEFANRIQPIAAAADVPFILNDHPPLVPSVGADGAHVGHDDLSVSDARWRAGRALAGEVPLPIIGKSTHSLAQAVAAAEAGADYIGFGPLYATATKPGRPAIGLADIAQVHALVTIPIFCIGGVNLQTLDAVIAAGARRLVIVSDLLRATDIPEYCREVRRRLPVITA